ncbi:tetratricopeptide repeat protein [Maridesulfovibrio salexigens]|uniref:TPR repeat-containing protein n=1 Tax=Maridesulfovibrio salexigens (strain ATCC 14822 / DSM 2638 / NCIMB 8403 / VKM B-1763) TaxID=526222 RepID=C6BZ42_MARSD|nr:tetratricopeptide repeat protein [Maridesulfovibrio salexigens]ACS78866.1 TPR repeat-containing protein [Maridesulfovibrio salexigens DSM 2638]
MSGESSLFNYTPPVEQENGEETEFITVVSLRSDSHKIKGKQYWLASKLDDESFELLLLNENRVPSGDPKVISNGEFAAHYTLELDYYQQHVRPAMEQQDNRLSRGESHREQGEFYSAEMEYAEALAVDEKNVRATFGLGLTYLEKGDVERAQEVFAKVLQLKSAFQTEHKHMFNDFGISMRKNGMYREALQYYNRGVDLDSADENLFFNIARTHYEAGDWENCFRYLTMCLEKNRGVQEAQKFCHYLIKKTEEDDSMLREMGKGDNGKTLRSDILNLLRKMQVAAGVELDDAIEKTHEIRDRMIALEEEDMQMKEIEKDLYNVDGD